MNNPKERPAGIILIAIYNLLGAFGLILLLLGMLFLQTLVGGDSGFGINWFFYGAALQVALFVFFIFYIIRGLWRLKESARKINFWFYLVSIPLVLAMALFERSLHDPQGILSVLISVIASMAIVWYLRKPFVIELFK